MDADVALRDFTSVPYVIERPAEPDLLADAATALLQKAGLRLHFGPQGRALAEHEASIARSLPVGMALLKRTGSGNRAPEVSVLVSGATPAPPSAMLIESWNAVGLATHGFDRQAAAAYAIEASLAHGGNPAEIADHPLSDSAVAIDSPEEDGFEVRPWGSAPRGPSWLPPEKFNANSLKTIQGVHADLLTVVARAREICPTPFEVVPGTGGIRTPETQDRLAAAGRSRAKIGRHTIGHAIDLVPVDGRGRVDFSDLDGFDAIRDAMEQAANELGIPIQWGGNWKKLVDLPHYELDRKVYPAPHEEADPGALQVAFR